MSAGAFEDEGDAIIEMDFLPPRWLDIQDEITDILKEIARQTSDLDQLHQKHILPGFDDEDVKKREERDIEQLTQLITRNFQKCQKSIQRIEAMVREAKRKEKLSRSEETMARNLKISLASRVGEVSALFRKKQSAYLKSMWLLFFSLFSISSTDHWQELRTLGGLNNPVQRSFNPAPDSSTDYSLLDSEADRDFSHSTIQQATAKRLSHSPNDSLIAQREREIEDIAQGIIELANIFQELQTMVIDQGTMLDRVDYNVETMAVEVKAADKELVVATGYQRRGTKRWIILLLLILIAGLFIILLVKPRKKDREIPEERTMPGKSNNAAPFGNNLWTLAVKDKRQLTWYSWHLMKSVSLQMLQCHSLWRRRAMLIMGNDLYLWAAATATGTFIRERGSARMSQWLRQAAGGCKLQSSTCLSLQRFYDFTSVVSIK